jgi:hypothetical protein
MLKRGNYTTFTFYLNNDLNRKKESYQICVLFFILELILKKLNNVFFFKN